MKIKLCKVDVKFEYGPLSANSLTPLKINQWYQDLGGTIRADTEVEFSSYFPRNRYQKTALTSRMPNTYLCEGSISVFIRQPSLNTTDVLSLSVYRDTSGHDLVTGDHRNLFLQWEINGKKDHTENIPNRHIPLKNDVCIRATVNDKEIKREIIK